MRVTFCTDLDKSVVVANCERRGWIQVGPDDEWNIYWAGTQTCRSLFSVDSGYRMNDNQYVIGIQKDYFRSYYRLQFIIVYICNGIGIQYFKYIFL